MKKIVVLLIAVCIVLSGCDSDNVQVNTEGEVSAIQEKQEEQAKKNIGDKEEIIYAEYKKLIDENVEPIKVTSYLQENINKIDNIDLTTQIIKELIPYRQKWVEKFNEELWSNNLNTKYTFDEIMDHPEDIDDETVKKLLIDINNSGYEIDICEESLFIADNPEYILNKFSEIISKEFHDYLEISSLRYKYGTYDSEEKSKEQMEKIEKFISTYPSSEYNGALQQYYDDLKYQLEHKDEWDTYGFIDVFKSYYA